MNELQVKLSFDYGKTSEWYDVESLDYEYKDVTFIDGVGESVETYYWNEPLRIKPPTLNENQRIVLEQLKINAGSNGSLIKAIHSLFNLLTISSNQLEKDCTEVLLKSKNALARLTRKQAAEVLSAFSKWAQEQEEE